MTFLKTAFTSAAFLAGGLLASAPQDADAQVRFYIGGGDGYVRSGHSHGGDYDSGRRGYRYDSGRYGHYDHHDGHHDGYRGSRYDGYRGARRFSSPHAGYRTWHDTSHYDYHPTTVVPHGNHYDVIPGHYHYHRSGHWH
ncbi:MAG TPA: hypothetical protein VF170_20625 [Planctomycetaceae bacterium]